MPRFTLHRSPDASVQTPVPEELRRDSRVRLIGELPRMLLIESSLAVADEWASKMKGWKLSLEQRAKVPDPRPTLKRRVR
jgi:hypothetical protein